MVGSRVRHTLCALFTAALTACGGAHSSNPGGQATALYNQLQAQIAARTRATLRPGTKIYYVPTIVVSDRGNGETFPGDSKINHTSKAVIVTPTDGSPVTFDSTARITYLPEGGKVFVAPGRAVPSFLRNPAPDEVIK